MPLKQPRLGMKSPGIFAGLGPSVGFAEGQSLRGFARRSTFRGCELVRTVLVVPLRHCSFWRIDGEEEKAKPPCLLSFFLVAEVTRNFMPICGNVCVAELQPASS
jgi:hypothetical protein